MSKGSAAWPRGIRWLVAIAVVVLALVIVWALFIPLADWLAHHDVGSVKGSPNGHRAGASRWFCLPWETSGGAGGLTGLERGLDGGHGARGWLRRNLTARWRQRMTARPGRRR